MTNDLIELRSHDSIPAPTTRHPNRRAWIVMESQSGKTRWTCASGLLVSHMDEQGATYGAPLHIVYDNHDQLIPGTKVVFNLTGQPGVIVRKLAGSEYQVDLFDREGRHFTSQATLWRAQLSVTEEQS